MTKETTTKIALFEKKEIRKVLYNNEWWFVITDVISVLTDTADPNGYIKDMRGRDDNLSTGWGQIATPLEFETPGGVQKINCANTESILRIIQSIPSPKAEPFKRWLARVGYERINEIENPELAMQRTRNLYKLMGRSEDWIEKRMRSIAIHEELTGEWKKRGISKSIEYAILTSEISKAAFGLTPSEYKKLKGLKRETLKDHMTDLELLFSMLADASTTEIAKKKDAQGFFQNKQVAYEGGTIAGNARKALELKTGTKVISRGNYLPLKKEVKKLK